MPVHLPKSLIAALLVVAVALIPTVGLGADPSLPRANDRALAAALDGVDPDRVFPDPLIAGDFIQYDSPDPVRPDYLTGLQELVERYGPESAHPVLRVDDICALICDDLTTGELAELEAGEYLLHDAMGNPMQITSAGGRELPVITVTAPGTPDNPVEDRLDLYFSMSIHGGERAGLEGGLRYIEDLALAYVDELTGGDPKVLTGGEDTPDNTEYASYTVVEALDRARIHFVNLNPDGWADGDRARSDAGDSGLFVRGNDNGIDLNRQWATLGWNNSGARYNTFNEPEAIAGRALIEEHMDTPEGAADLHGELTDNVLLAIMFPAGQFDQVQLQGQYRLAEAIKHNVNTSVHPGAAGLLSGVIDGPVYPAEYHTAYDAISYDDSGFQGDYLVQQGILEMDHEYIASNLIPSSVFVPELEQVHVDTTRALLDATIAVTLASYDADGIVVAADLGGRHVGYVFDPEVTTHHDVQNPPRYERIPQRPYAASSMQFFDDLRPYLDEGSALTPIGRTALVDGQAALGAFDTIVVTDDVLSGETGSGWSALRTWVEADESRNLVLTDAALEGLQSMGLVAEDSVERITQYAGEIQSVDRDHPLLTDIGGIVRQTYFEVPLGHQMGTAPAYTVDEAEWAALGGDVAAVAGESNADELAGAGSLSGSGADAVVFTEGAPTLGVADLADGGRITIFGAILPDPSNVGPNAHGLADYAVTYAGNSILLNALRG